MAVDSKLAMQASTTKTAAFDSAGVDLQTGTPRRGLYARVIYSAAATSSGAGTATFEVQESADNATFVKIAQTTESVLTLSTTAQSGEVFIPFETSKRYVRLSLTAVTGTGASVTYQGDISLSRP